MKMRTITTIAVWAGLLLAVAATAGAQAQPAAAQVGSAQANVPQLEARPRYKIEPGDSFDIAFELSPEFNQAAISVQPDGFVTLKGVGDLMVQGKTVPELTETLRQEYGKFLNNPTVSVVLKDFQKPYFVADGQVLRPGKYDLRADTTLTEALAIAGGLTDASKHSHVQLYRRVSNGWTFAQIVNVKRMEKSGQLTEDPYLHPGDMLFVPKNNWSKVMPFIPRTGASAAAVSAY
ncbi:putative Polysaccharide export protein [Candidatus Sulfotelmatobacter kueseliae]|uniref:Putative Polysaccharide export protein n=1 Tax=Candidatus Sulfotelmatobacter kueseliae TaxID=2042962 RepID=A0A2U3KW89_9BACT|nr:putative Polysaccharide export protein [Candidatus Sulfotelmatobacter kueseliae]